MYLRDFETRLVVRHVCSFVYPFGKVEVNCIGFDRLLQKSLQSWLDKMEMVWHCCQAVGGKD